MPSRVVVVGLAAGRPDAIDAMDAVDAADLVIGGRRHLDALGARARRTQVIEGDVPAVLDAVAAEPGVVCVLASGDPGFFGIVRPLAARFGPARLEVHPEPSAVSLAFARLGLSWDDAVVVSVHGRPLEVALSALQGSPSKAAVLVSPDNPPEKLGRALLDAGLAYRQVVVCARLGTTHERVEAVSVEELAAGSWDPLSVVVLLADDGVPADKTLAWGRPESAFAHHAGLITKAEVRAVALGKLALPASGVLWDVGTGSGSVAIEAALLAPALRVLAVERDARRAGQARANAAAQQAWNVEVVEGDAPGALGALADPDRVFVGGGGIDVLDAALARLRPGGAAVATFAAVDRAAAAYARLGHLVQVAVSRAEAFAAADGVRLVAENPVFVAWGPA